MNSRSYKWILAAVAAALFFGVSRVQWALTSDRERLGLNGYNDKGELRGAPPVLALTTVALGGFRGLISNLLWMRASDLQDHDKYFEMVQLADWITKLEPHFPMVWQVQAWNMAFNISVKFNDPADRWRWVERGIELIRDDGLKYNPYDVAMHHELGWIFQFKMGGNMDDAQGYYKMEWAEEMENIFNSEKPDWNELTHPTTDDARRRVALLRDKYKMNPDLMKQIDETYGPLEWRLPEAHAIYWAMAGLEAAKRNERKVEPGTLIQLHRIVYQSMNLAFERGRLIRVRSGKEEKTVDFGPNLDIIANVNKAYEQAIQEEDPKFQNDLQSAHRYLLLDAIFYFHTYGRDRDAQQWFNYLAQKYPDKGMLVGQPGSLPSKMSVDDYCIQRLEEEVKTLGQYKTQAVLEGLERQSLMSLVVDEDDRSAALDAMAVQIYKRYEDKIAPSAGSEARLALRNPKEVRGQMLSDLLTSGTLTPEAAAILATKTGVTNLPPATNSVPQVPKNQ